jgi:hypothetical protein
MEDGYYTSMIDFDSNRLAAEPITEAGLIGACIAIDEIGTASEAQFKRISQHFHRYVEERMSNAWDCRLQVPVH